MTIGELAEKSGVPASTIRYWEKIGVLPLSARVSGQRRYSGNDVDLLAVLRLAQACGFRLDGMRHLMHGFRSGTAASLRWQELASKKQQELDMQIARLKGMRRVVERVSRCRCVELAECGRVAASVRNSQL
jgi:DNA-binding transcriptional MerR regulator